MSISTGMDVKFVNVTSGTFPPGFIPDEGTLYFINDTHEVYLGATKVANVSTDIAIPVAVASGGTGATSAAAAITNLGAVDLASNQTVSGVKSFTGGLDAASVSYIDSNGTELGSAEMTTAASSSTYTITELGPNSAEELYSLPAATNTDSSSAESYNIITTKNPSDLWAAGPSILTSAQYGDALPALGADGQLYFLREDSPSGLVDTTTNQTVGGIKTFTDYPEIKMNSAPGIKFRNDDGTLLGMLYQGTGTTNSISHAASVQFQERSYDSTTGAVSAYYEQYALPAVSPDRTTNAQHYIWTSKQAGWEDGNSRRVLTSGSTTIIGIGNENNDMIGEIYWSGAKTNNITHGRWYIGHYSYDSTTGARTNYYEGYYLPTVNANRTTSATYDILTTKNKYTYDNTAVTFSAGTAGTRGAQYAITQAALGGTPRFWYVTYVSDSSNMHPLVFSAGETVYVNIYRASGSAVTNGRITVDIYYT